MAADTASLPVQANAAAPIMTFGATKAVKAALICRTPAKFDPRQALRPLRRWGTPAEGIHLFHLAWAGSFSCIVGDRRPLAGAALRTVVIRRTNQHAKE